MKELFEALEEKIETVEHYAFKAKVDAYALVSVYSNLMNFIKDTYENAGETTKKHIKKVFPKIVDRLKDVHERLANLKDKDYLVPKNHSSAGFLYLVDLMVKTSMEVKELIHPRVQTKKPMKKKSNKVHYRA